MWTCKISELDDGPTTREFDASRANYECKGGFRALGENPSLELEDEGALQKSVGVRKTNEEGRVKGHIPGATGPPTPPTNEEPRQPRIWVRGYVVHRHGDRGKGKQAHEYTPKHHPVWVHSSEFRVL